MYGDIRASNVGTGEYVVIKVGIGSRSGKAEADNLGLLRGETR